MPTAKKKPASDKRAAPTRKAAPARAPEKKQAVKPIRREVGAVVCLLLALFAALGYFASDAWFIHIFGTALKGLLGYGFWIVPPLLLLAAYILGFHRGRPVRLRLVSALLLPLLLGALLHLFLAKGDYPWSLGMVADLWKSGVLLESGGVCSGLLALGFAQVFSKVGTSIVFIILGILMLLFSFNRTLVDVVDSFRNRPRAHYEPKAPPVPTPAPVPHAVERPAKTGKPIIDIPVEDGPLVGVAPETAAKPKKSRFFNRERSVPTPEEVLTGAASHPPVPEPPADDEDFTAAVPPVVTAFPSAGVTRPAPPVAPPIVAPEPSEEPAEPVVPKVTAKDAAKAAREVSREIAGSLQDPAPTAYQYPPVSLLIDEEHTVGAEALGELKVNQDRLTETIRSFGIDAKISGVVRGPSVTRYELELDQGIRLNKLTNLADDIALSLGAEAVRIAPIPDKISTVGIEVPNKFVSTVHIHEVIDSKEFRDHPSKVAFSVGRDIAGNCIVGNIAKLPHLLIAGTTGSGKSVCTNSLIISLLYKATPDEVRLIMVDPKMVELGIYNGIPHLLIPVVTDPKKAAGALQWAVVEMMKRYRAFSEVGSRDLAAYNAHAVKTEGMEKMPQIVVLIDELADLMLVAAKEVEESICRVAQMGRAAGMHLVIATQRPSADVITGLMKANIPSRIAFAVSSSLESRIILDTTGADKLVGKGDMLFFPLGAGKPRRVQGCFVTDEEVAAVVDFVKKSGTAQYDEEIIHEIDLHAEEKTSKGSVGGSAPEGTDNDYDELLPAAIEVVLEVGQASVSMLQRRLKLGYGRAARLVDQMEECGIVGAFEGSKPRQLLITKEQWQERQFKEGITPPPSIPPDTWKPEDEPEPSPEDDEPPFDEDDEV